VIEHAATTLSRFDAMPGLHDLIVSGVIRRNELQVWFVAERVVQMPLAQAK
jgi:hypothetical protein